MEVEPANLQVLCRIITCGVCHTDAHLAKGEFGKASHILGHEGVGVVEKVGPLVSKSLVGKRVGLPWAYSNCGSCDLCVDGRENLCSSQLNRGLQESGAFAPYALADSRYIIPIPSSLSSSQASPLICAGLTVWRALREVQASPGISPGSSIGVIGCGGGLGTLASRIAIAQNYQVLGFDCEGKRKYVENSLHIPFFPPDSTPSQVSGASNGGLHAALLIAPNIASMELGIACLRPGGTAVVIGLPQGKLSLDVLDFVLKGKRLLGSLVGTRADAASCLRFCASHNISIQVSEYTPKDLGECIERVGQGGVEGRQVIRWAPEPILT